MIEFHVPGDPIPQGSKKAFARGSRVVLVEANTRLKSWRAAVTLAARAAGRGRVLQGPIQVVLEFTMTRPRTSRREWPTVKPDLDKLTRAILDGVTDAGLWKDDSEVCEILAIKRYGSQAGATVRLVEGWRSPDAGQATT